MSNSPRATQRRDRAAASVSLGGRIRRRAMVAALLAATVSGALAAQVIRGTISDSASRLPIAGAVITLVDSAGTILRRNISNESGQYSVAYVRAARSLHVVRIGFQQRELQVPEAPNRDSAVDVIMAPFNASLGAIRVSDKLSCPRRADRAAALAFWDQARAGLLNTVVARANNSMAVDRLHFQRAFNGDKESIGRFVVDRDTALRVTSFEAAHTARDFVRQGFGDSGDVGLIFGPDADVLLDDAFAQGYCFRLAEPTKSRPNQVGLAFSPSDFKRGRVDIDGTLWIDTSARVLRDVEYRYLGLDPLTEKFRPGGKISFATSANGISFIDRWHLRLFSNPQDAASAPNCRAGCAAKFYYPTENGGEVSHVGWPDGRRWDASLGTVSIRARTTGGKPAEGAAVQLHDTHYHATADSNGTIVIHDLLPGPYTVRIRDERIAQLGWFLPTPVKFTAVRDSVIQLRVEAQTVEEYLTRLCQRDWQWELRDSTFVFGRVVDEDGKPIAGARVSFALKQLSGAWVFEKDAYKTDTDGLFQTCKSTYTHGRTVLVRVVRAGHQPVDVAQLITSSLTVVKVAVSTRP